MKEPFEKPRRLLVSNVRGFGDDTAGELEGNLLIFEQFHTKAVFRGSDKLKIVADALYQLEFAKGIEEQRPNSDGGVNMQIPSGQGILGKEQRNCMDQRSAQGNGNTAVGICLKPDEGFQAAEQGHITESTRDQKKHKV